MRDQFADADARRNPSSRRKSNEDGTSRKQTSLYTKIDIFFPVHGNGDYGLGWSETSLGDNKKVLR